MTDEPEHPADKAIGAGGGRPPRQVLMERAWAKLDPQKRERYTALQRVGWCDVPREEQLAGEPAEKAWVEYELVPPPDADDEAPLLIDRWPLSVEIDETNRQGAITSEWDER